MRPDSSILSASSSVKQSATQENHGTLELSIVFARGRKERGNSRRLVKVDQARCRNIFVQLSHLTQRPVDRPCPDPELLNRVLNRPNLRFHLRHQRLKRPELLLRPFQDLPHLVTLLLDRQHMEAHLEARKNRRKRARSRDGH